MASGDRERLVNDALDGIEQSPSLSERLMSEESGSSSTDSLVETAVIFS